MLDCWRTGGANSPETFVTAIAATLARYPDQVIYDVTDPRSGLPIQISWMPTIKEVFDACERAYLPIREHVEREKRIAEQMEARRREDEDRALQPRPSYAELKAKYGDGWGITPPVQAPVDPEANKRKLQRDQQMMLREYAALGIEPQYTKDGMLISPALVLQIKGQRELEKHIDDGFSPASVG